MPAKKKVFNEQELIVITSRKAQSFLRNDNVTSVGVGYKITKGKPTKQLCIQYTVAKKQSLEQLKTAQMEPLPQHIEYQGEKVAVDVLERSYHGHFELVSEDVQLSDTEVASRVRKRRHDPVKPGISVSHINGTAGTLGAIVYDKDTGQPLVLSNWHVLHGNEGSIGDNIVQPGPYDNSDVVNNVMGKLVRSHLGLAGDCAVASITERQFSEKILGLDTVPTKIAKANLGDEVVKSGRSTGDTFGIVSRVGVITKLDYGHGVGVKRIGGFEISPNPNKLPDDGEISSGGDSGSLWLIDDGNKDIAVGLHYAGETDPRPSAEHAVACNIDAVMEQLNISFVGPEELVDDEDLFNELFARIEQLSLRVAQLEAGNNANGIGASSQQSCPNCATSGQTQAVGLEGVKVYGNWCGPKHGSGTPVDALDQACMNHDLCYDRNGYFDCNCDEGLLREIDQLIASGRLSGRARVIAPLIRGWFSLQPCATRIAGVPIPMGTGGTTHLVKSVVRKGKRVWKKIKRWF